MLWPKLIIFALVSLALVHLQQATQEESTIGNCSANFTLVGDKCLLISEVWKSWYEADRYCRSLNAGLISIETPKQLDALNQWLQLVAPYQIDFWSSGNCLGKKGDYFWQSTGAQARYLPWAEGQPQASAGDCLSLYADFIFSETGEVTLEKHRLKITNCTSWTALICEQKPIQYKSLVCLNPEAFHEAKIPV